MATAQFGRSFQGGLRSLSVLARTAEVDRRRSARPIHHPLPDWQPHAGSSGDAGRGLRGREQTPHQAAPSRDPRKVHQGPCPLGALGPRATGAGCRSVPQRGLRPARRGQRGAHGHACAEHGDAKPAHPREKEMRSPELGSWTRSAGGVLQPTQTTRRPTQSQTLIVIIVALILIMTRILIIISRKHKINENSKNKKSVSKLYYY